VEVNPARRRYRRFEEEHTQPFLHYFATHTAVKPIKRRTGLSTGETPHNATRYPLLIPRILSEASYSSRDRSRQRKLPDPTSMSRTVGGRVAQWEHPFQRSGSFPRHCRRWTNTRPEARAQPCKFRLAIILTVTAFLPLLVSRPQ
jgi:hypothetical protein